MDRSKILAEIHNVFCDILDNENIKLNFDTNSGDIEEWDSLTHIQLIVAIEKRFGIKFTAKEMMGWDTVGDMVNCISSKLT